MLQFAKVLANLALLCVVTKAADISTYSKEYFVSDHVGDHAMPESISFAEHNFLYVICERITDTTFKHCNVTIEMVNGQHKYCTVQLNRFDPIAVERVGDKVMLQSMTVVDMKGPKVTYGNRKINLINMESCTQLPLEFPIDNEYWYNHMIVNYHDSFDVQITNNSRLCGNYAKCVFRYNYKSQLLGDPTNFPLNYPSLHSTPVDRFHPEKGAYFLTSEGEGLDAMVHAVHVKEGVKTDLFSYPIKDVKPKTISMKYSNDYDHFTVCYLVNSADNKVHCMQYDVMGHKKMDATVDMEKDQYLLNVFNLQSGGLIFLHRGCPGATDCTTFHVKTMDLEGHVIKNFEVPELMYQCDPPSKNLVVDHKETDSEHCFYFACAHMRPSKSSFKYISKCLDKKTYF